MTEIEEIVKKIDQIIQASSSAYVYTDNCGCVTKILQEVRSKIANLSNDSDKNKLNDFFTNLNKLYVIIDGFTPNKWSQNSLQVPIMKPISDLKDIMNEIINNLLELKISPSKFEVSTENIVNDLKSIYGIFVDPERITDNKVIAKREEIEQQLNELGQPLINTSQRNPSRTKSSSSDNQNQERKQESSEQDASNDNPDADLSNINNFNNVQKYKLKKTDYTQEQKPILMNDRYSIYKGQLNSTKEPVTIMELDESRTSEEKFKRFVNVLTSVQHPNLESFVGYVESPTPYVVVTRRNGEKFSDVLQRAKNRMEQKMKSKSVDFKEEMTEEDHIELKEGYRTTIAFNIALAMAYLHSLNIIHRDLYSTNIMIDSAFNPKITNFANSRYLPEDLSLLSYKPKSTGNFKAPELYATEVYGKSSDVFAFGGLLYELLTGNPPYSKLKPKRIEEKILANERPSLPAETSDKLIQLITKCWAQDPKDRPTFLTIIDDMLENEISFPTDDNEIVKQFYASKKIKNVDLKVCIQLFRQIEISISNCYAYMFEAVRIRTLLYAYKYILQTSELATKSDIDDVDTITHLGNLRHSLENLHKTLEQTEYNKWKGISLQFPATEIPNDLHRFMEDVYVEMTQLGFTVDKYDYVDNDLTRDFRSIYSYFKRHKEGNEDIVDQRMKEVEEFLYERDLNLIMTDDEMSEQFNNLFSQFTNYYVDRSDFKFISRLGRGMSAEVSKAKQISQKRDVAIKEFKKDYLEDEDAVLLLRREIAFLVTLHHEYIISFIGYNNDPGLNLWVVSEFVKNGDLMFAINRKKFARDPFKKTKIAFEIAEGMEYLHKNNVIHRDLKPGNVLLNGDTPKITDFGYSRMNMSLTMTTKVGTARYMAPEVINGGTYGFKADVFSFSMILWELYTNGANPFPGVKNDQDIMEKIAENTPLLFTEVISPDLKELILKCRSFNAEERPSFTEIVDTMLDKQLAFNGSSPGDLEEFYEKKFKKREESKADVLAPASSSLSVSTVLTFS